MTDHSPLYGRRPTPTRNIVGFVVAILSSLTVFLLWATPSSKSLRSVEVPAEPATVVSEGSFVKGTTLYDVLKDAALTPPTIYKISRSLKKTINPRTLKSTDRYKVVMSTGGVFHELIITRNLKKYVVRSSAPGAYTTVIKAVPLVSENHLAAGVLQSSLWESMRRQNITSDVIMGFSDIFAWNVDFLTEPRAGDQFALLWKKQTTPAGKVINKKIEGALYEGRYTGRKLAVWFQGQYYDENGHSLRRAFLRAPLNFRRISSRFSRRRFHPILRYFRPHLGIDYAAPKGTPVVSVGNGTVVFKGRNRGYGNYVKVRHNGTYTTLYGHFSRFAKKIKKGARVKQGQVIGYVGSTGLATGPHLDFRISKNGSFVNFLKLKIPADKKIPASQRPAFEEVKKRFLEKLLPAINKPSQDQSYRS